MNYRHAYHAGNFADCFKHALLVAILDSLVRKPTPFFVLDTHAGAGRYDLTTEPSRRTAEADLGIKRLMSSRGAVLDRYLGLVTQLGMYPGSPAFIQAMLREKDRLACCELHPEEAAVLRRLMRSDTRVEVHARSGWEALNGLLPPKERRGLVFIDPPFEDRDEFVTLADGLQRGHARFRHGILSAWYPIKQMASVRTFHANLRASGMRDIVAIELRLRETTNPDRLNGCGLAVVNPPFQFEMQAPAIAEAVLDGLGVVEAGAGTSFIRLADE